MKLLLIAGAVIAALGAGSNHMSKDDRISAVAGYKQWEQATKGAVRMGPRLWTLCRHPTPAEQKALDDFNKNNPHSNGYFRVYMNDLARAPLMSGSPFPPGSTLVKEKMVGPDTGLIARTVMRKHEKGWNAKTDNWEFYVVTKDMQLEDTKDSNCISCHSSKSKMNWVYRTYVSSRAKH